MDSKERISRALSISTDTRIFEMGCGIADKALENSIDHKESCPCCNCGRPV